MSRSDGASYAQDALFSKFGNLQAVILSTLLAIIIGSIANRLTGLRYPADLPRIREKGSKTRFSFRTRLAYYTDAKALYREAYEQVGTRLNCTTESANSF